MKKPIFRLCRGTFFIGIICFSLIFLSLCAVWSYLNFPSLASSEDGRWLIHHGAHVFDTICASLLLAISGAALYEYTYRKEAQSKS